MPGFIYLIVLIIQATSVASLSTFSTNCTAPLETAGYVSSPNTRGTLQILWTCLFTTLSCTWTVLHLDVPTPKEKHEPGIASWIGDTIRKRLEYICWFLSTIFAPEIILTLYWSQRRRAREGLLEVEEWNNVDGVKWDITHCHFANMGGFVMRANISGYPNNALKVNNETNSPVKGFYDSDSQRSIENQEDHPRSRDLGREEVARLSDKSASLVYTLKTYDIVKLLKHGRLRELPRITKEEIEDHSKTDGLMRLITLSQILWFCIEIISRSAQGLAVSQLEITVLAFASCAVVIYWLNWNKPKDVRVPITILYFDEQGQKELALIGRCVNQSDEESSSKATSKTIWQRVRHFMMLCAYVVEKSSNEDTKELRHPIVGVFIGGTMFGGIHLVAWNFAFPNHAELILWRTAAICCTVIPAMSIFIQPFLFGIVTYLFTHGIDIGILSLRYFSITSSTGHVGNFILGKLMALEIVIYFIARLFLLVEMFRTLAFLPSDAYIDTWAQNVPFFG